MASTYDVQTSAVFRNLNAIDIASFFLATAVWGSNISNSILFAFRSNQPRNRKLVVAWFWSLTTLAQGLLTSRVEQDYFGWGFISSKLSFGREGLDISILLTSALVSISSQVFFLRFIRARQRTWFLLPIFAAPPMLFQLVLPLGLLFASPTSSWREHQKSVMFATLMSNAILNVLISGAMATVLWVDHFGGVEKVKWNAPLLMRLILFPLHTNAWATVFSISSPIMFYYLYSYLNLFLLYHHLLSPLSFMSILAILDSPLAYDELEGAARRRKTQPSRSRLTTDGVSGESLRFQNFNSSGAATNQGSGSTAAFGTVLTATERSFEYTIHSQSQSGSGETTQIRVQKA